MHRKRAVVALTLILTLAGAVALEVSQTRGQADKPDADAKPKGVVGLADEEFDKKDYADAAKLYGQRIDNEPHDDQWRHAVKRQIACYLRLQRFDDAIAAAERHIKDTSGTPYEARAERMTGNLYLTVPHWGTRSGGKFHRAQWKQGIHVRSYTHDKKRAIAHLERARMLYKQWHGQIGDTAEPGAPATPDKAKGLSDDELANWRNERIECTFDLAGAAARFGIFENNQQFWWSYWGERDDERSETAGENDFDEYYNRGQWYRQRPIGLKLDAKGNPIFPFKPKEYKPTLQDDQKILYLLDEARQLDITDDKRYTALSFYRQGMLARARWGMDRLNMYASSYWYNGQYPLKQDLQAINPWEMKDSEAIVLAGGQVRKVKMPAQWDAFSLLRTVVDDYKQAGLAGQAQYAVGLNYQSRQQYKSALAEYDKLISGQIKDPTWANNAGTQVQRIKASQVRISQAGVQLPANAGSADPAKVQISYRNTDQVWFVAREIDHVGFMRDLRARPVHPEKGYPYFWPLQNWHQHFVHPHYNHEIRNIAAKYVGKEVARWSDKVENDGTHRYKTATLQTPLDMRGAYLVYAYLKEPPGGDAAKTGKHAINLGNSRAVLVMTDLAIVDKPVKDGKLYYISDARSGAPVANSNVKALEVWSESKKDGKRWKTIYHKVMHTLKTDDQGMALLKRPTGRRYGQLHLLVDAQGDAEGDKDEPALRTAWSGMSYWNHYRPSRMRNGLFAYCITDRPVYRPNQNVQFKVWLRQMNNGLLQNRPNQSVTVTIYDPRGNKVKSFSKQADQWGGIDGTYELPDEPPLGMYRIYIHGRSYAGGQNFRVEEYKKPEFEVTVEPGKDHAKLGEMLTAKVKATYFFGGAVTDATIKYKVFREEYRHSYYFPSRWDWLYGPGYGYAWYDYDWYPWWGHVRCCRVAPGWWWGYSGIQRANPVRELVQQGEGRINPDGTLDIEIDTADAARNHGDVDHQYVIEAEVRDSSRRTITGQGTVKVTRQAYYNVMQPGRGYYKPGEEMFIKVRSLTPANQPVKTEGVVTVSEVVFGGPNNAHIKETQLKTWRAETNDLGELTIQLRHERSGQLKIKFESPDEWGGKVEGYALIWVVGDDFDGKLHRFNNLELITDKREYKPGDVAHVMINTKHAGSYVLYSGDVDNNTLIDYKLLHLPGRSTVVDVPITKNSAPNFFIEATTVADTRVHQQTRRIVVPPEKGVLQVSVASDKAEYKPGERANVEVTARTLDGKPAEAQVTLSAFDKSVLYIQGETTPPIAKFFHGNLRSHSLQMRTNLYEQFSAWGYMHRPFEQLYPLPASWNGVWGPVVADWRSVSGEDVGFLGGLREETRRDGVNKNESYFLGAKLDRARQQSTGQAAFASDAATPSPAANAAPGRASNALFAETASRKSLGKSKSGAADKESSDDSGADPLIEAEVRTKFADTAVWLTTLTTDSDGRATASFDMPENLTTWKINAWAMTKGTKVGQADAQAITTKNLLVRLQAPRFFMEYDEVVISANVHNYLASPKRAQVSIGVPDKYLKLMKGVKKTVEVNVPANGEVRVDWRVKVHGEGVAKVLVKALTNEESDAMAMTFPVLVHGMHKQVATTGSMRPKQDNHSMTVEFEVPDKRRPELTQLEVQFAPSLVGAMMDALPYCLDYPYGCTEQTMSRFLPAVLTLKTLQEMGIKLEDVRKIRGRLAEIRRIEKGENISIYGTYADSPIFDSDELSKIIQGSLTRIRGMQNGDGGWGWWKNNASSPYLTAYVLYSLVMAQRADVQVDQNMINRGMNWLQNYEQQWMRDPHWSPHAGRCFAAYVLSLGNKEATIKPAKGDERQPTLTGRLYRRRDKLNNYGRALLGLCFVEQDKLEAARTMRSNIKQYLKANFETETAYVESPKTGWWYWYNNDIETNAWYLRLVSALEPDGGEGAMLVKWLLNNRRNGYYWRSTRDTTLVINAMSDWVIASGEAHANYTLTFDFDNGKVVKKVKINKDTFFTYDNRFLLEGVALGSGKHTLKISKSGRGALYFNTYLRYFTKEEHITASGHELKVDRKYYKLQQIPYEVEVEGADGHKLIEKRLRYQRIPVNNGDAVKSGDVIQVELKISSDNDYTYLAIEDMKPAGCEPTQVRSGGKGQEGFYSYMEMRDEKTVFFVAGVQQGEHLLRYRLRAETPGVFHALPTKYYAMYVPELRANSDENVIRIVD